MSDHMNTPDFDQIARTLLEHVEEEQRDDSIASDEQAALLVAEQLRQVWNARGAADVKAVAAERASDAAVGWIATVIRELDR